MLVFTCLPYATDPVGGYTTESVTHGYSARPDIAAEHCH